MYPGSSLAAELRDDRLELGDAFVGMFERILLTGVFLLESGVVSLECRVFRGELAVDFGVLVV